MYVSRLAPIYMYMFVLIHKYINVSIGTQMYMFWEVKKTMFQFLFTIFSRKINFLLKIF